MKKIRDAVLNAVYKCGDDDDSLIDSVLEIDKTARNEISRYMIRQVDCEKN